MSNLFPAVPADLQLAQLQYIAVLPDVSIQPGSPLAYGTGVTPELIYTPPQLGASFVFTVPGTFGAFDQGAFEALLTQSVTAVVQVLAGMSGEDAGALQKLVTVSRTWTWSDSGGYQLTWQDTMPYAVTLP